MSKLCLFKHVLFITCVTAAGIASTAAATGTPSTPEFPPFGINLSAMDRSVKPGDDFFRYVNGRWYDTVKFPPDQVYVGSRPRVSELRDRRVHRILEDAASNPGSGHTAQLIGAFYASFMNEKQIDAAGLAPATAGLARIRAIKTLPELFRMFAEAPRTGLPSPIDATTFYDLHAPGWMRYTLTPGGLGLPLRHSYLAKSSKPLRIAYRNYVRDILKLAGEAHAERKAGAILALETQLAKLQWPTAEAHNFRKTANSLSIAQLQALTPNFDWHTFLAHAGVGNIDTVIVSQPSAMAPLIATVRATPLATWRAWAVFHYLSDNAPYLGRELRERQFAFYGKRLGGQQTEKPRWQRGVEVVDRFLGMGVGQLYVKRWFPESSKRMVAAIFANIRAEMRSRIEHSAWMSKSTRAEALKKIDRLIVQIGYPSQGPNYSGLHFDRNDFYANLETARAYRWRQEVKLLHAKLSRNKWMMMPQSTGAAANPVFDVITVPAGGLEPPFFDPNADPAVNYGAIGGVMGHELSHMFDELGRRIDASGKLRDWWTPRDAKRYQQIAAKVVHQYSQFEALPGLNVNGKLTLNENIADISGLTIAWGAYHRFLDGRKAPVIDGFTGDQRLFMGWAQMRAGKIRPQTLRQLLASDPHSPDIFRVNGVVRNIDAWYKAFNVTPNDRLYLPPAKRAHFW